MHQSVAYPFWCYISSLHKHTVRCLVDNHTPCLQFRVIIDKTAINTGYKSFCSSVSGPRSKITGSSGRLCIYLSFILKKVRPLSKLIVSFHVPNKDVGELCLLQFHQHQGQQSPHELHSNRGFFSLVSLLNDVDRLWDQKEDKK